MRYCFNQTQKKQLYVTTKRTGFFMISIPMVNINTVNGTELSLSAFWGF